MTEEQHFAISLKKGKIMDFYVEGRTPKFNGMGEYVKPKDYTKPEVSVVVWRLPKDDYCPVCDDETLRWEDGKAKCQTCGLKAKLTFLGIEYNKALTPTEVLRLYRRRTGDEVEK